MESICAGHTAVTGVLEEPNYAENVETALKLHPSAKHIIIVNDGINEQVYWPFVSLDELSEVVNKYKTRVEFSTFMLNSENADRLLDELSGRENESVLFLAGNFTDTEGKICFEQPHWKGFWSKCDVPTYVVAWELLDLGPVVGGCIDSAFRQGWVAADMALRILQGQDPQDIPVVVGTEEYIFNYPQMRHFGIDRAALPADSIVINKPVSFYHHHRQKNLGDSRAYRAAADCDSCPFD
jgi:hypothetical protein